MTEFPSNTFCFDIILFFFLWSINLTRYETWINSTEWIEKSIKNQLVSVWFWPDCEMLCSFFFFFLVSSDFENPNPSYMYHILIKIAQRDHLFDDCLRINIKIRFLIKKETWQNSLWISLWRYFSRLIGELYLYGIFRPE